MYLKRLQHRFKCSSATLQKMIDTIDVETFESEEDSALEIRKIDPPVVNGINLREHPNEAQRERYNKILDNGIVCGVFKNDVMLYLAPTTDGIRVGKTVEDFEPMRKKHVMRNVNARITKAIEHNFDTVSKGRGSAMRPKIMTPADFWAQFTPNEMDAIRKSQEQSVIDFVDLINNMPTVPLKSANVKAGLSTLLMNTVITNKTYSELSEV